MTTKIIPKIFFLTFLYVIASEFSFSQSGRDTLSTVWNLLTVPSSGVIKVITIDSNNTIYIGVWGDGIYRSYNNGQNWTQINQGLTNKFITAIERDSSGRLFASSYGGGVYLSTNNGQSWSQINSGLPTLKVKALTIKNPSTIFIAVEGYGVYRSTNQGTSWQSVSKGIWNLDINCLVIADDGSVIAGTNGNGIYFSNNDGGNWRRSGFANDLRVITSFAKTGIGEILCGTYQGGVYSSVDNGISWSVFKRNDTLKNVTAVTFANNEEPIAGTDKIGIWRFDSRAYLDWVMTNLRDVGITAMARSSQGNLFAATPDGSLFISTNSGATWTNIRSGTQNIKAFFSFNNVLYLSLQTAQTFRSTDMGLSWNEIALTNIQVNSFAADSNGRVFALANRTDTNLSILLISTDNGITWNSLLTKKDTSFRSIGIKNNYIFLGISFPPANPRDPNSPFTDVLRSNDAGITWNSLNIRAKSTNGINFIGINHNGNIFVSLTDSLIKSTDNGNTWVSLLGKTMYNYNSISFGSNSSIFIAGDYGILISTDDGNNWTIKPLGLLHQYMQTICVTKFDQILAGSTYGGILSSSNFGSNWDSTHIYYGFIREPISVIQSDNEAYFWIVTPSNIYRAIDPKAIHSASLVWPSNNSFGQPLIINFQWTPIPNSDLYEFQISDDYDFNTIKETIKLSPTNWTNYYKLSYNTIYFWRIRGWVNNAFGEWSTTSHFKTIIAPPILISPSNKKGGVPTKPKFVWQTSDGATGYILQVSKSPNFSPLVFEKIISKDNDTIYISEVTLDYYQTYYWRISAKSGSTQSDWSEVWQFTTNIQPPQLRSPANKTYGIPTIATLQWTPSPGGNIYEIQIALDSNFERKFFEGIAPQNDEYQTKLLEPFTKYFWRVRATNEDASSDWSEVWWFITLIPPPQLESPADNSKNLKSPILFRWSPFFRTEKNHLQIATDDAFTSLLINDSNLVENEFSLSSVEFNQTYFWRVRSKIQHYYSNWSSTFSFRSTIRPPSLLYPHNNQDSVPTTVTFQWGTTPGATSYDFVLSLDSTFSRDIIFARNEHPDTIITVQSLSYNTRYFWHVRAMNPSTTSEWSDTWSFITKSEPSFVTQEEDGIVVNPNQFGQNFAVIIPNNLKPQSVKLYDLEGRMIMELSNFKDNEINFDLSNQPSGIYLLIIRTKDKEMALKIFKN